jgi:transposase
MLLSTEEWMDLRAYRALREAGATWAEIARETGHDWRTVKKYLSPDAPGRPPAATACRTNKRKLIDDYKPLVDAMLAKNRRLRATVIHQRLVAEHGFGGSYQRTKLYVAEARERLWPEPPDLHRRFEVLPGAQAQVDWGDEGFVETENGPTHVGSFHMTLSYSRDPFCCFVTSQDLVTFWDCHRRAFDHFQGVPASIVYDRTKTVVRKHVRRHQDVALHPEAIAFAAHYGFRIVVAPARRPQFKAWATDCTSWLHGQEDVAPRAVGVTGSGAPGPILPLAGEPRRRRCDRSSRSTSCAGLVAPARGWACRAQRIIASGWGGA